MPTTRDLYAELQAVTPDSLRYLLSDLFEVNTYWELSTENATAEEVKDGWVVTLDAMAEKVTVDTVGTRTNATMNDLLEVGVFGESGEVLYRGLHRIRSGLQRISIRVPSRPVRAGIDPRHLLIDVEPENNFKPVRISR